MVNRMYFYGIFDKNDDCLYVGKTVNPRDAKSRHKSYQPWREEIHYFKILVIEDDTEMGLINEYQTKYNKERYTGGVSKYDVGDIFGHIDDSKNTYPRKIKSAPCRIITAKSNSFPLTGVSYNKKATRIRHKPTGVIYRSSYALVKAGLTTNQNIYYLLQKSPDSKYHDIFEFAD